MRYLFIAFLCAWSCQLGYAEAHDGETSEAVLSATERTAVEEFIITVSGEVPTSVCDAPARFSEMSPGDRHFSVNEGIAGMDCRVSIDSATGIVRSYQRVHRKEELNAPKDPSTITRSDVFPLILPITKQYGLSEDSSGYEIREVSASGGFSVHKMLDYQGVPCRNSRLYVGIGANGKVEVLWYDPVIVPAEPTKTIPVTEAISAVQQWLKSLEYFRDKDARIIEDAEAKCQKVIAGPNKFFQKREMQASDALRSEEAYYSWEVPFTFTEHGHDLTVRAWVNVETGEVIGAY